MKARSWLAVALGGVIAMTMLVSAAPAQEKKAPKPAPQSKTEQAMPGCPMHGMATAAAEKAPAGKPGCAMGAAAAKSGCAMMGAGGMGGGCCMMAGAAGKGGCCCMGGGKSGGMGCCAAGGAKGPMAGGMGCGMMGGPGMAGCRMGGPMAGDMGPGLRPEPLLRRLRALDLTADQKTRLADIVERHQKLAITKRADMQLAMLDLRKAFQDPKPDRARIDAAIDKVARLRTDLAKARVAALFEARALLTPEQLRKWEETPGEPMGLMDDEDFGIE